MRHEELLIDGTFWGGPCDQAISKTVSRDPFTGRTIGTAAESSTQEAVAAAMAAARSFESFCRTTAHERSDLLFSIASEVARRGDDLTETLRQEIGKPIRLARGEVQRMELTFRIAAEEAGKLSDEAIDISADPRSHGTKVLARRFPIGPILAITPYNWPFNLAAHKIAPALATGNTLVVKGAPQSSLSSLMLGRLLHEAGLPAGVANFIQCDVPIARQLVQRPEFAMISFTGSAEVGWEIKRSADPRKRVALELGGNAFAIVTDSADMGRAARELVESAYSYAGQICISAQHVLIDESAFEMAKEQLVSEVLRVKVGDPADPDVLCGPMISVQAAEKVQALVNEAVSAGAKVLVEGSRKGTLLSPWLLSNVPPDSRLANEEAFGPVLTIEPFASLSDAIARVNSGRYGLQASLYTKDGETQRRCFEELKVGGLLVNAPPSLRFDAMPYGGVKDSGFGREGIRFAMEEMTDWKALVVRE